MPVNKAAEGDNTETHCGSAITGAAANTPARQPSMAKPTISQGLSNRKPSRLGTTPPPRPSSTAVASASHGEVAAAAN